MAGFVGAIARVNLLATARPGFVWRLSEPGRHLDGAELLGVPDSIIHVSVWTDYESLHAFVYRGLHGRYLTARARGFLPAAGHSTALWWVSPESRPTAAEAAARLSSLTVWGPSPRAFTVLHRYPARAASLVQCRETDAGGSRQTSALDAAGGQGVPWSGRRGAGHDDETGTFWVGDTGFESVSRLSANVALVRANAA